MSGTERLRQAVHHTAKQHAQREQAVRRGSVTRTDPLTISLFGFAHPLREDDDFELSAWMRIYQHVVGVRVDDLVLVSYDDALVVFDIVSDTDVVAKFRTRGLS